MSINDLTDELAIDALSGNASFSGVSVEVLAAAGDARADRETTAGARPARESRAP